MRESFGHIDSRIVFRENFTSEQNTRRNGGTPTDVGFSNGVGTFNGSSSFIDTNKYILTDIFTVRVKFKSSSTIDRQVFFDNRASANVGFWLSMDTSGFINMRFNGSNKSSINTFNDGLWHEAVVVKTTTSEYLYVDGELEGSFSIGASVISTTKTIYIGRVNYTSDDYVDGDLDLVEYYNKDLTAKEVSNLWNKKTYKELPDNIDEQISGELHTNANAASIDNETNATTGFTSVNLDVFQSQSINTNNSNYALEANSNGNPLSLARINLDLSAAPFNLIDGDIVRLTFDARHIGVGGRWDIGIGSTAAILAETDIDLRDTDNTWNTYTINFIFNSSYKFFLAKESNTPNDGGIYLDNLSVKKIQEGTGIEKILDVNAFGGVIQNKFDGTYSDNIVINGDFETGDTTGWSFVLSSGSVVSFQGQPQCVESTVTVESTSAMTQSLVWGNGTKYRLKFKYYIPSTNTRKKLQIYGIGGTNTQYYVNVSPVLDQWADVEVEIEATPAHTLLYFYNGGTGLGVIGDVYYYDDIELTPIREIKLTDVKTSQLDSNVWSPEFNVITSKIDCGNIDPLTGDITIMSWVKVDSYGQSGGSNGTIFSNGKIELRLQDIGSGRMLLTSDGVTLLFAAFARSRLGKSILVTFRRYANGTLDLLLDNELIINGQNSGTPAAGTTNIIIGNVSTGGRAIGDLIPRTILYKGIVSDQQIAQAVSNNRRYYE